MGSGALKVLPVPVDQFSKSRRDQGSTAGTNDEDRFPPVLTKIQAQIDHFPIGEREGEWQSMIQKMVASYLVHHSYCATAEAFAKSTDQAVHEELASIKNRQKIQKLVLSGRMGEAIETTQQLYPNLLERNPDLLFMLKVRQFIEMVNGTDSEVRCLGGRSPKSQDSYPGSPRPFGSPSHKPNSSQPYLSGTSQLNCCNGVTTNKSHSSSPHSHKSCPAGSGPSPPGSDLSLNGSRSQQTISSSDVDMEVDHFTNGVTESSSNGFLNGSSKHATEPEDCEADMEVESAQNKRQLCGGSQAAIERMIHFGRELQSMSEHLRRECGKNSANKKMLKDAFSLLAYSDPWNSPVGYQLDAIQREPVCSTLNSAILETHNLPKQPPLAQADLAEMERRMWTLLKPENGSFPCFYPFGFDWRCGDGRRLAPVFVFSFPGLQAVEEKRATLITLDIGTRSSRRTRNLQYCQLHQIKNQIFGMSAPQQVCQKQEVSLAPCDIISLFLVWS
ncbi:hypothetical protein fugu_013921 [Takifugu bimaculatus]|uniref:CTLH domain-containing protein n=1 Tax=Takifugu bimaculatus TaxID=433685 RepID=A0A4Z2BZQ2_9TELE|nr:hypothetical protein fugu_013921 [Takifugu bimaculatus]